MLGLLVSGIFAAAMAGMDTGLNRNAGIFVKNFYQRILRPRASENELLQASRVFTVVFGLLIIAGGVLIALYRDMNLFDFAITIGSLIGVPLVVPLTLGLFVRRTPAWAGWSTALVGLCAALAAKWWIGPSLFGWVTGANVAGLRPQELVDINFATTVFLVIGIGSAWYFVTTRFAPARETPYQQEVEAFFSDMERPVDPIKENLAYDDGRQYEKLGKLCLVYGGVTLLGVLIPNGWQGRLSFLYVAGAMLVIGAVLYARRTRNRDKTTEPGAPSTPAAQPSTSLPSAHE